MFGFNKKKKQRDQANKKQSGLDKILMGAIVGGAIGSVLGVGLAPKKGSDTRKDLGKQAGKLLKTARNSINSNAGKFLHQKATKNPSDRPVSINKFGKQSLPEE